MNFGEIKSQFTSLLNRRDLTASLTNIFYQMAVQRLQRELRVPAMENLVAHTTDGTDTIEIPGDYLENISLFVNDGSTNRRLERVDAQTIARYRMTRGNPLYYHRIRGNFIIGPYPSANETIYQSYYQDASGLVNDTDTNWVTNAAPDLLIYGMLSYAADYYLDDRLQLFEDRYQSIVKNLQEMAAQDELVNGTILPVYGQSDYDPQLGY